MRGRPESRPPALPSGSTLTPVFEPGIRRSPIVETERKVARATTFGQAAMPDPPSKDDETAVEPKS